MHMYNETTGWAKKSKSKPKMEANRHARKVIAHRQQEMIR
jgi:hypothetical protein